MTVYLRKQLIADTPTTKKEVYNFTTNAFYGIEPIEVKTEPDWWRNFDTKTEALKHLTIY